MEPGESMSFSHFNFTIIILILSTECYWKSLNTTKNKREDGKKQVR
jgi:hypothetical protein